MTRGMSRAKTPFAKMTRSQDEMARCQSCDLVRDISRILCMAFAMRVLILKECLVRNRNDADLARSHGCINFGMYREYAVSEQNDAVILEAFPVK
jgi:hypothetical protein